MTQTTKESPQCPRRMAQPQKKGRVSSWVCGVFAIKRKTLAVLSHFIPSNSASNWTTRTYRRSPRFRSVTSSRSSVARELRGPVRCRVVIAKSPADGTASFFRLPIFPLESPR